MQGKTQITFLIGGSVGLDESLKQQADWRLSIMLRRAFHLARIMLLEQITVPCRSPAAQMPQIGGLTHGKLELYRPSMSPRGPRMIGFATKRPLLR